MAGFFRRTSTLSRAASAREGRRGLLTIAVDRPLQASPRQKNRYRHRYIRPPAPCSARPVPCEPRSTRPPDRMARRTSAQHRWRRPMSYHQGSPDILSRRGLTAPDRDPCANPDPRSSAACWRRPQSGSHRRQSLLRQPDRPRYMFRQPARNLSLAEALVAGGGYWPVSTLSGLI